MRANFKFSLQNRNFGVSIHGLANEDHPLDSPSIELQTHQICRSKALADLPFPKK